MENHTVTLSPEDRLRLDRAITRPAYLVGFWWPEQQRPDEAPEDTLVAHSTADALATWLDRYDNVRFARSIARLRAAAERCDERWDREGDLPHVRRELERRRTMSNASDGCDPWLVAKIIHEVP